ncbi:MAG: type IV secretion protein [Pseudomonadota bacterium]
MLDLPQSQIIKSLIGKNQGQEQLLSENLPYLTAVDDGTILLRDGDLIASFAVDGIDASTADEVRVADLAGVVSRLIAQEQDNVAFYIHKISAETKPEMPPVENQPFAAELDQRWRTFLQTSGLRRRVIMVTFVIRPSKLTGFFARFASDRAEKDREEMRKNVTKLNRLVTAFTENMTQTKPRRLTISSGEWLGLLRSMVSGMYAPIYPGVRFTPINDLIANTNVNFMGDLLTIFGSSSQTLRYAAVLTLKDYPSSTFAGIFDGLNLHFDMVVTNSFTRIDNVSALSVIERSKRQRAATEDAAISLAEQLEIAGDDLASGRIVFGKHHSTVTVFANTEAELDDAVSMVNRAITENGGVVARESMAAQAEFFAQHPGNFNYRTRPAMISSLNFAEMAALHGRSSGRPAEKSPWGDAVTILPTIYGEPYRFNFHMAGKRDERTVGHSIVLGQTGSGKTLGTAFLLSQSLRLNPRIIVFDKDRGFEMALRAMGGHYTSVRMGVDTGFNPFQAESDERGTAWLADWLSALAESGSSELSPVQREALAQATQANSGADRALQNFQMFRTQVQSTDDDGDLHTRLSRWDKNGQFGWLFNGTGEDSLTLDHQIVGFDLTEIFDNDVIRTAWLSYIFRRIERMVEDEHPTFVVLDEAWKLLDDPYFQTRLKDWMLTMRKKNVAVILLTQRVSHLTDSAAGDAILESAVTRLVYPSSYNTLEEVKPLNLTTNETEFLLSSNDGNRFVLLKSGEDSVVLNMNLYAIGGALGVLGGGPGETAPHGWRDDEEFWQELI